MFCPKCGQKNEDGSQFCAFCGESFVDNGHANSQNSANVQIAKSLVTDAISAIKNFIKGPKEFIENYVSSEGTSSLATFFIALEVICALAFAFITKVSSSNLIMKYIKAIGRAESMNSSDMVLAKKIINSATTKGFITLLVLLFISVAIKILFRYIISNKMSTNNNNAKIFSLLSIISVVESAGFVVMILEVLYLSKVLYFDYNKMIALMESLSSISDNITRLPSYFAQIKSTTTGITSNINGAARANVICTIIYTLVIVFEILCITRVKNALKLEKNMEKSVSILIAVFLIVLIILNLYFSIFATSKVIYDGFMTIIKSAGMF